MPGVVSRGRGSVLVLTRAKANQRAGEFQQVGPPVYVCEDCCVCVCVLARACVCWRVRVRVRRSDAPAFCASKSERENGAEKTTLSHSSLSSDGQSAPARARLAGAPSSTTAPPLAVCGCASPPPHRRRPHTHNNDTHAAVPSLSPSCVTHSSRLPHTPPHGVCGSLAGGADRGRRHPRQGQGHRRRRADADARRGRRGGRAAVPHRRCGGVVVLPGGGRRCEGRREEGGGEGGRCTHRLFCFGGGLAAREGGRPPRGGRARQPRMRAVVEDWHVPLDTRFTFPHTQRKTQARPRRLCTGASRGASTALPTSPSGSCGPPCLKWGGTGGEWWRWVACVWAGGGGTGARRKQKHHPIRPRRPA